MREKIIDGILHFEAEGCERWIKGEWVPYCQQALTRMLIDARASQHIEHIEVVPCYYVDPTAGCDEG